MKKILFALGILLPWFGQSQQYVDLVLEDRVYEPFIKSVRFNVEGIYLSYPVLDINGDTRLVMSFDDIEGGTRDYFYTLIHCDRNWEPSQLAAMEYLQGFSQERIQNFQFSFKTIDTYTHYSFALPNNSMRWTKTGNYILIVYEEDGGYRYPLITRRFVVADTKVRVEPNLVRPAQAGKLRTHQEIDFLVDHERFPLRNPRQEITAVVLQNGRWETAVSRPPLFLRGNVMLFDYQDQFVFPAGKEFRYLDLRSLRVRSENVAQIDRYRDRIDVVLYKDQMRESEPYIEYEDINGDFVIETLEQNNDELSANYVNVLFSLYAPTPFTDHDVYLLGTFTNWRPLEEYRMVYNNSINAYVAKLFLKQGFYNYAYGLVEVEDDTRKVDFSRTEGNWFETENNYTILVYYRPFGGRYDEVIGFLQLSSN